MKNIDKLISALYHAKSDNRERMFSDLLLTVLYSSGGYLHITKIIDNVKDYFHLEPIKYEVEQCLIELVKTNQITQKGSTYCITELTQSQIHASLVKGRDNLDKRFDAFNKIVIEIFSEDIEKKDVQKLWDVYNEYILECFMVFGRKAINIFLPYKKDDLPQNDSVLEQAKKNLGSDKLYSIFKRLIIEYPERLTDAELRHLNALATRAEKFYSLGIEKEEYDKINNLQIRNLIVIADTNILYAILNLHVHQEKSAITEIIRLAKDKVIDFKIVFLPKTYKELQKAKKPLENIISREKFKNSQIKAMLNSGKLDALSKQYYENLLQNGDHPHPADNIAYASDILNQQGILIYNNKFQKLEDEYEQFNKRITEYYDFQNVFNTVYLEKGSTLRLIKDDYKIEHDVFLREALKTLKEKFSKDILKFICLTTDRSLIHFDQYMLEKENIGTNGIITPNFMMPSVFIRKIRPFLPMITNNYRKAFISSLTAPAFHKENDEDKEKAILTQKSLTYFKNLGIEDEDVICSIIKRELFLEELSKHEGDNTAEEFIKSEIGKEIENLKLHKLTLEKEIKENEMEFVAQKHSTELILEKKNEESEKLKSEKEKSEKEKQSVIEELVDKIKEKEILEEQLEKLNQEKEKFSKERELELRRQILEEVNQSIFTLKNAEKPLLDIIETRHNRYKWYASLVPIGYVFIMCFLIKQFSWDTMEPYTWFSSIFVALASYLYFAISGKSFSPIEHFKRNKIKITEVVYSDFKFNISYLNDQLKRKGDLEEEIEKLSSK